MNYIAELNAFYHFMLRKKMPKSEFALLTVLYMINNAEDWELWFEADNELLQRLTGGYSREALNTARNGLKQKNRIDFRPGKRNEEAAKYRILPFIPENDVISDMKPDMKLDMKADMEPDMKLDTKTKHKQNKDCLSSVSPLEKFETFWECYPLHKNRPGTEKAYADVVRDGLCTEDSLVKAAQNYAEYCGILERQEPFIKTPVKWLSEMNWTDYIPGEYRKPQAEVRKSTVPFNQFTQNNYDFADLEKRLLERSGN